MDIRICPECAVLFDIDKRLILLNFGTIACPCCKNDINIDDYIKYE